MAHATIRWALATAVAAGAIGTGAVLAAAPASAEDAAPTAVPTMIGGDVPSTVNSGVGVDTSAPAATKLLLGAAVPVALGGVVLFVRRRGQRV